MDFRKLTRAALFTVWSVAISAQDRPRGLHPRPSANEYAVKAVMQGQSYAASLVPNDQVSHIFAFDISKTYLVFEVACYPGDGKLVEIDPEDFVLKAGAKGELAHQADAATVAAAIQRQHVPKLGQHNNTSVVTEANVGYQSGQDPYTGQRVHGVYGGAGVAIARGDGLTPPYPTPGGLPEDRELLQAQLHERALPAGKFDHPIAGYLYFPRSSVKKDANGNYVLQHLGDANATARLAVPSKTH